MYICGVSMISLQAGMEFSLDRVLGSRRPGSKLFGVMGSGGCICFF